MKYDIESILEKYEDDYTPSAMVPGPRNMKLAEVPRSEMDNFNTPDLDQGADSILKPGETLEDDFDVEFRRPNAQGGVIGKPGGLVEDGVTMYGVKETDSGKYRVDAARPNKKISKVLNTKKQADAFLKKFYKDNPTYAEQGIRSPKEEKYFSRVSDEKRDVLDKYAKKYHKGKLYSELDSKDAKAIYQKAAGQKFVFKEKLVSDAFEPKQKTALKNAFPKIKFKFTLNQKYGVPRSHPQYDELVSFQERGFSEKNKSSFNKIQQKKIIDSHELPEGVKKWDFKNFQYGVSSKDHMNLTKRIDNTINKKPNKIAADFSSPKGWMMHSMNRVYENQIKNSGKSDYKPLYNKDKSKIIGFIDNTPAGKGNAYYGLNKNTPDGAVAWGAHGDFNRVKKFVDISKRTMEAPDKIIQKILDKKGITVNLRLNDILSHDRFYSKLSETAPTELIKKQIVQHHTGGVGSNPLTKAAATKDIQLLTAANNLTAKKYETILKGTAKNAARKLTAEENTILKNMGAKITGPDGKVYGGGYLDPEKQYSLINKQAKEMVKGDQFNVKTVANYLERLGCGGKFGGGGRINFAEGVPSLTKCGKKGVAKIEKGLANGFKKSDVGLAQKILGSGKFLKNAVSLRGLFGPAALAFTAAAEAGIVGYDMLASGKSFKEAIGDSVFNYALGDKTKIDSDEEFMKRLKNIKVGPQGYQRMGDAEIGKMLNFKTNLDDMKRGFDLYGKLDAIGENRKQIGNNPEDTFSKGAFQLDLNKQEDPVRADIRDYNKTGTPRRVTDYLLSDKAKEGADATAYANLLVKEDQLKNAGTGDFLPKVDQGIARNLKQTQYGIDNLLNPKKLDEFGEYFVSRPKSEQSYMMGLGYKEGGIASLNVKK